MHERANHARKIKDWQFVLELHRKMVREWFVYLPSPERLALLFIYDRTLGWGKEWERITMDQCVQGIVSEDGTRYAAPFSTCRKHASRIVKSLVEKGVVFSKRGRTGYDRANRYAINFDWNPTMQLPKRLKTGLKTPQKPQKSGVDIPPSLGVDIPRREGVDIPPQRVLHKREDTRKRISATADADRKSSGIDSRKELEIAIVQVKAKSQSRSALKKGDGRFARKDGTGFIPLKSRIPLFWRDLWLEHFPGEQIDPLTKVSQQILFHYWQSWVASRTAGEFMDYLSWVFENWNAIRLGSFQWMTNFPTTPALRMITSAKLRVCFEQAYREKESIAVLRKMGPHERKLHDLIRGGMDPEKAQSVVDREFASRKEMKELRDARDKLSIMMEAFNRRKAKVERSGNAPIVKAPRKRSLGTNNNFGKWKDEE